MTAWLMALWLPLQWHASFLLTETLVALLVGLLVLALASLVRSPSSSWAALGVGIAAAVVSLSHSAYQFLPWIVVVALAVHFLVYERRLLPRVGLVLLAALAVVVPYNVVRAVEGFPRLGEGGHGYGSGGGWTLYVGSRASTHWEVTPDDYLLSRSYVPNGLRQLAPRIERGEVHVEPHLRKIIERKIAGARPGTDPHLTDGDYYRAGIENLLGSPTRLPDKLQTSVRDLFLTHSHWPTYPLPERGLASGWIRDVWTAILAAAVVGMLAGIVRTAVRRRDRLVLFAPLVFQSLVFLVSTPESRYAYPLESLILTAVAIAILGPGAREIVLERADAAATSAMPEATGTRVSLSVHQPSSAD